MRNIRDIKLKEIVLGLTNLGFNSVVAAEHNVLYNGPNCEISGVNIIIGFEETYPSGVFSELPSNFSYSEVMPNIREIEKMQNLRANMPLDWITGEINIRSMLYFEIDREDGSFVEDSKELEKAIDDLMEWINSRDAEGMKAVLILFQK